MACMSSCSGSVMILFPPGLQARGALQSAHAGLEQPAALEARNQAAPGVRLFDRQGAGIYTRSRDRMGDRRIAGDDYVVGDGEVAGEASAAADHAALADRGAAGHADAGGERTVGANAHVVSDLDEVVELHTLLDHGVVDGAAIDGGVGADLDIRSDAHRAQLWHLEPGAALGREA